MNENQLEYETIPSKTPFYQNREFWGSAFFLIIVLINIGLSFLNSFVKIDNMRVSIILTQAVIVIPAFIYMLCLKENPFKFIRFRKFNFWSALLIPLFMYSLLPVISLVNAISMTFSTNVISTSVNDIIGGNLFVGLLLAAVLPGFVEETTFRGAIYHSVRGARPVRAIILSAVMFGLMHMNFNQFLYATVLGIIMGFLLEATGSILSTMLLHFCFNGNSVLMMYLLPKLYDYLGKMTGQDYGDVFEQAQNADKAQMLATIPVLIPVAIVGLAFAFLFYYLIAKLNKRWYYIRFLFAKQTKDQRDAFDKPRLLYVVTFIGMGICLAFCILTEIMLRLK